MPSETLTSIDDVRKALALLANPEIAAHSARFFKTGPGEYGEGDEFMGIRVPRLRAVAAISKTIHWSEVTNLLHSPLHEERLTALIMWVNRFKKASHDERKAIFDAYLQNRRWVNNWDLVDTSCHQIVGGWLLERDRSFLRELAQSDVLWDRRIAIVSTYRFIQNGEFFDTLEIAECLLNDREDLIHKAVGWMLREVGNRMPDIEMTFLDQHYHGMPRTMLRYAIERFPNPLRQEYLKGTR